MHIKVLQTRRTQWLHGKATLRSSSLTMRKSQSDPSKSAFTNTAGNTRGSIGVRQKRLGSSTPDRGSDMGNIVDPNSLHRTAKYFMDNGRAESHDEAMTLLAQFGLTIYVGDRK